jgi:GTP-binding protein HflX
MVQGCGAAPKPPGAALRNSPDARAVAPPDPRMSTSFIDSEELRVQSSGAVLCGVIFPQDEELPGVGPLDELVLLCDTLGVKVLAETTQRMPAPNPHTYCGSGKAEELAKMCADEQAKLLIFNNDLRPQHQRALAELTKARVIDRTELILLIFAEHARSHQSKIAVELARCEYQLPRLKNLWSHLERQRGAVGKMGGAGELQIETDRRLIRNRISKCKGELEEIEKRRLIEVGNRRGQFQVALVGYTNAGKSTLMKALTEADVYIADQLFATLDTRTRVWDVNGHHILLSDTVGFIRDLPHSLVASFHATLSEALNADLLLHVVDCSHPGADQMVTAVEGVLKELGAEAKRTLLVLNKADLLSNQVLLGRLEERYPDNVLVSAKSGAGVARLTERVQKIVEESERLLELEVPASNGKLLAFLNQNCKLIEQEYDGDVARVKVLVAPRWLRRVEELLGKPLAELEAIRQQAAL